MQETKHQRQSQRGDDIIAGRNAVQEALRSAEPSTAYTLPVETVPAPWLP